MAPEQARGQTDRVGLAADVYALGATLYSLLAGPADEFIAMADVTLAGLDAVALAWDKRDWTAGAERARYALGRLDDAERFHVSPAYADFQRITLGVLLAAIKVSQAEAALKAQPPDTAAARKLLEEADRLARTHLAIKVRHDPVLSAALKPGEAMARDRGERVLQALDRLKKELGEKK